jgi:hypothetical protein
MHRVPIGRTSSGHLHPVSLCLLFGTFPAAAPLLFSIASPQWEITFQRFSRSATDRTELPVYVTIANGSSLDR